MYNLLKVNSQTYVLFDKQTMQPCLFALRYHVDQLGFKSVNYQRLELKSIKLFYEFWWAKFSETFDHSFYKSELTGIDTVIYEVDCFHMYLRQENALPSQITQLNRKSINDNTVVAHIKSVGRFINFLIDCYISSIYLDIDIKTIHISIKEYKEKLSFVLSKYKPSKKPENSIIFKSLTEEQFKDFFSIIRPSTRTKPNLNNPYLNTHTQYRNYLLVKLTAKYGLRISEALLLRKTSFLTNLAETKFYMRVDSLEDNDDPRIYTPSIKTSSSIRTLEISGHDYRELVDYYESIRPIIKEHSFLFISVKYPHPPLSYRAVWEAFKLFNEAFKKNYPEHYKKEYSDYINSVTPHSMRHTWAYNALLMFYQDGLNYRNYDTKNAKAPLEINGILDDAKEKLRVLGGWSKGSLMPGYYALRFISESANERLINLWGNSLEIETKDLNGSQF